MLMSILYTILLILLTCKCLNQFIFGKAKYKKEYFWKNKRKKASLDDKFNLKELKREINEFNNKDTLLFFHCEKLNYKYYFKPIIL